MADAHSTQSRDRAVSLLAHYFATVFQASGLKWDSDSVAELEEAVDAIIDAAKSTTLAVVDRRSDRQ